MTGKQRPPLSQRQTVDVVGKRERAGVSDAQGGLYPSRRDERIANLENRGPVWPGDARINVENIYALDPLYTYQHAWNSLYPSYFPLATRYKYTTM